MASMCETCKCSTYYDPDLDTFHCENDCECCNDPDYKSEWERHTEMMDEIKKFATDSLTELDKHLKEVELQMEESEDFESPEYANLEIDQVSTLGEKVGIRRMLIRILEIEKQEFEGN